MSLPRLAIHPAVESASTIDKDFYLDPAVFAHMREAVFARNWLWLGDAADVALPGSLAPRELMPGLLDEPLVLARDATGVLRLLSNVCTHRGNILVHEACRAGQIRCGYHSRRFDLAGRMTFMPGFDGACDFPSARDHLPELPLHEWHGHLFTAIEGNESIDALLAPVDERLPWLDIAGLRPDPARARSFEFDAHWALYVENYLEGLHIPFLHPGLNAALDIGSYRYELFERGNLQLALARDGEPAFEPPASAPEHGQRIAAYYFWLWPNLMLNFYPWGLSVNLVLPLAPAHTRVIFRSYIGDASKLASGAGGALDPVEMEDEAAVIAVQRGIRSRLYRGGRYSPVHERGVHQFHRLLAAAAVMASTASPQTGSSR
jgi:choline monooxygenase